MSTTPGQAQALLNALGNPEGWAANGDMIYADRALFVSGSTFREPCHTYCLRTYFNGIPNVLADEVPSLMAASIHMVDEQLAKYVGKKEGLLTVTDHNGWSFIDNTPENKAVLAELRAQCRFATAEEVAAGPPWPHIHLSLPCSTMWTARACLAS